jgi:hypothetical protein
MFSGQKRDKGGTKWDTQLLIHSMMQTHFEINSILFFYFGTTLRDNRTDGELTQKWDCNLHCNSKIFLRNFFE